MEKIFLIIEDILSDRKARGIIYDCIYYYFRCYSESQLFYMIYDKSNELIDKYYDYYLKALNRKYNFHDILADRAKRTIDKCKNKNIDYNLQYDHDINDRLWLSFITNKNRVLVNNFFYDYDILLNMMKDYNPINRKDTIDEDKKLKPIPKKISELHSKIFWEAGHDIHALSERILEDVLIERVMNNGVKKERFNFEVQREKYQEEELHKKWDLLRKEKSYLYNFKKRN